MLYVHEDRKDEFLAKGYTQIGRPLPLRDGRPSSWVAFVQTDKTCLREMRTGLCLMDKGHRGRCSTVVFWCDGCGKSRRGMPHAEVRNNFDGTVEVELCFMCTREERDRYPWS